MRTRLLQIKALLLFLCLQFCFASANAQWSTHTSTYTVQNGLAQNSVKDMLKDADGFLWMVSKDGLSRFDGYEFKNYKASSKELKRSVSNQFLSLKKDGSGCLWLLNDIGQVLRFDPKTEVFTLYPSAEENKGQNYFMTVRWRQISENEIWLMGANAEGAIRILVDSTSTVRLKRYCESSERQSGCDVRDVVCDASNRLWILSYYGVWTISEGDSTMVYYKLFGTRNRSVYEMLETENELIFACSNGEIHKYDKTHRRETNITLPTEEDLISVKRVDATSYAVETAKGLRFVLNLSNDKVLEEGMTHSSNKEDDLIVLRDTMGVLWSTTHNAGIEKVVTFNESFRQTLCEKESDQRSSNDISSVMEDNERRLWVATKDGRLRLYDEKENLIGFIDEDGNVGKKPANFHTVSVMYQDREGRIWLATRRSVMRLESISESKFKVTNCTPISERYSPLSYQFTDILEDSKGHLWLTALNGGLHYLQETPNGYRFIHKENDFKDLYPPTVEQSHALMEDHLGNLWVGSSEGLMLLSTDFESPEQVRFLFYNTENTTLTNSCIYDIFQDQKNNIWLASYGGGLFKLDDSNGFVLFQTPSFLSFSRQNSSFPSDLLLGITDDSQHNLWILTEESIVKFDPAQLTTESFGQFRGFRADVFAGRALIRRYSGDLVATTNKGFYSFSPTDIVTDDYSPNIVFTRFLLFNKEHQKENTKRYENINYLKEITLKPNQSVFSIEYAALDYRFPDNIRYAYKLEPFETEWNYVGSQRIASYTNLPKGEYRFVVKSTNSEGIWYENERSIKIIVEPTFWQTGWAYLLYALVLGLIVGVLVYLYNMRVKIRTDKEVSDSKLQFFTDISHELRTPLTLISAPLENVLEHGNIGEEDRQQLEVVRTNAERMLRMMNQILDFRKIQSNKMRLKVQKTNLGAFVSSCSSNFLRVAENRHIFFSIEDHTNGAMFWIDRDKIDMVMFNLLSNAFKFTTEGKRVSVDISVQNDYGVITVSDEGCGMAKEKLPIIFERYTTLQDYSLTKQSGTGIGLSLVKEVVDMHKATIEVESEVGKGSKFIVTIRPGKEHFGEKVEMVDADLEEATTVDAEPVEVGEKKEELSILIVEDNDQMREFLRNVLRKQFKVVEAENGKVGLETAIRELPNFILTDVMMPEMDGIEMTRKLRLEESTSHIPIILLTAKTDLQSKIECMKIGANDYITKPFSMDYLEVRIKNILDERRKWQEKYRSELLRMMEAEEGKPAVSQPSETQPSEDKEETSDSVATPVLEQADDKLMRRFIDVIEANMGNVDFSAEDVEAMLKISHWHLLSKVKALVGMTPTEFIRETRLAHAAKLIDEGKLSMTQITYVIGMSDSRYFSRCFKQKYGVTPTEYKNRKKL